MTRPTPRTIWVSAITFGFAANITCWRKGTMATLCASTIRPLLKALGPLARPAVIGGCVVFYRHLFKRT